MGLTSIEWLRTYLKDGSYVSGFSANGWIGCSQADPSCNLCYAERMDNRFKRTPEGWGKGKPRLYNENFAKSVHQLERKAKRDNIRYKVFLFSVADLFDQEVPDEWRARTFEVIRDCPHLDFLCLTKRIEHVQPFMDKHPEFFADNRMPPNVWLGTSLGRNKERWRILELAKIKAKIRFLSLEPMIGPIDLLNGNGTVGDFEELDESSPYFNSVILSSAVGQPREWTCCPACQGVRYRQVDPYVENCPECGGLGQAIHWIITGGESGPSFKGKKPRPTHPLWFDEIQEFCDDFGIAYFHKQNGYWTPFDDSSGLSSLLDTTPEEFDKAVRRCWTLWTDGSFEKGDHAHLKKSGDPVLMHPTLKKKLSGRLLGGCEYNEQPDTFFRHYDLYSRSYYAEWRGLNNAPAVIKAVAEYESCAAQVADELRGCDEGD